MLAISVLCYLEKVGLCVVWLARVAVVAFEQSLFMFDFIPFAVSSLGVPFLHLGLPEAPEGGRLACLRGQQVSPGAIGFVTPVPSLLVTGSGSTRRTWPGGPTTKAGGRHAPTCRRRSSTKRRKTNILIWTKMQNKFTFSGQKETPVFKNKYLF